MSNYTKEERSSIVQALTSAKQYLWDGEGEKSINQERAICFALDSAYIVDACDAFGNAETCRVIMARLSPTTSVPSWLELQGIPFEEQSFPRVQAHRHAWVDQLIKEFSE